MAHRDSVNVLQVVLYERNEAFILRHALSFLPKKEVSKYEINEIYTT